MCQAYLTFVPPQPFYGLYQSPINMSDHAGMKRLDFMVESESA